LYIENNILYAYERSEIEVYFVSADWEPLAYVTVTSMLIPMHFDNCFYIICTVCFTVLESFYCKILCEKECDREIHAKEGMLYKNEVES